MINRIIKGGHNLLSESMYLSWGRQIMIDWCGQYIDQINSRAVRILDLGCGQGEDLLNVRESIKHRTAELVGVEFHRPYIERAIQNGIEVFELDIERQSIPAPDERFDIVIANQVIEHTKEIFWIFSEISRVMIKGGILIVGVPNLLSLHNRMIILFGEQPTSIELLGPHVRGFTVPGFRRFIEADEYFKILKIQGSNFYPFPPSISKTLSRWFPTLSASLFFLIKRLTKKGNFIHVLDTRSFETKYFRGN